MKKKILSIALAVAILAIASIGTLAYFTYTTPKRDNVFTVGKIGIELNENFEDNQVLLPGTPTVTKQVTVKNTGNNDAYVRVHIAIPSALDNLEDPYKSPLMVFTSTADLGQWNWSKGTRTGGGLPAAAGDWNMYVAQIDGVDYNVYVATYETKLATGISTSCAIDSICLNSELTQEKANEFKDILGGDNWHIYVVAEAVQADGFTDALTAFNNSYSPIGSYNPFVPAP